MSSGNSSSFSMPQNQEKKQIPRYEVRFTNKNHPFMWLVCKTRAKILLSDPETSLTTPRLLPLRRSRRSYGNYQSPQSSGSSRNILKRLGRSGRSERSYGNQALVTARIKVSSFALQNTTSLLAGNLLLLYAHTHRRGAATSVRTAGCFILTTGKEKNNCPYKP